MAQSVILKSKEMKKTRAASGKIVRTYTHTYQVISNDASESEVFIIEANDGVKAIPAMYAAHPNDANAIVIDKTARTDGESPRPSWTVVVEYSSDKEKFPTSPLYPDRAPVYSFNWSKEERVITESLDSSPVPIVNTAKDPLNPALTAGIPIPRKTVQINLDNDDVISWLSQFYNATNSDSYDGFSAGQVLVEEVSAQEEFYTDPEDEDTQIPYWNISITFAYSSDSWGWKKRILSEGVRELYTDSGTVKKRPILVNGRDATANVALDEDGHAILGDDVSSAAYMEFTVHRSVSFADLVF